jgi:uncharacterized circularly permuted ATP-grasp superfamily protein
MSKNSTLSFQPGIYNSAYFEYSYLAQQMGAGISEGRDLAVRDIVYKDYDHGGLQTCGCHLSSVDDDFIDPLEV